MGKKSIIGLLIIGILFAGVGGFLYFRDKNNQKYYVTTSAVIVDIDSNTTIYYEDGSGVESNTEFDVYIDYEVDGVKYENVLYDGFTVGMKEGDVITITYDVRNPGAPFSLTVNTIAFIGFMVIGGVIILVAVVRLIKSRDSFSEDSEIDKI